MARFVARDVFHVPDSLPKTHYAGHHAAATLQIKRLLASMDVVLECRDFRLPLSTHNPLLEQLAAGKHRLVVYTKADLGAACQARARPVLRRLHGPDAVVFWQASRAADSRALLARLRGLVASGAPCASLIGLRALVVGMPNVGKSSLLNGLRRAGAPPGRPAPAKAARTGDQAGVTRAVGSPVRVAIAAAADADSDADAESSVLVLDTPGVFPPYVADGETMLKMGLVQGIKKGLVPDRLLADYLLFRLNLWDPAAYAGYCPPTNDVAHFLATVARRSGKLGPGGVPNLHEAAAIVLTRWRAGKLGRFVLDGLSDADIDAHTRRLLQPDRSMNQAKKMYKTERRNRRLVA